MPRTSARVARQASKLLKKSQPRKIQKSVAASDLSDRRKSKHK